MKFIDFTNKMYFNFTHTHQKSLKLDQMSLMNNLVQQFYESDHV